MRKKTKLRFILILLILPIFSLADIALAADRAEPFDIGETLDPGAESPACGPTDANCFPGALPTGSSGEVQFNNGDGNFGASSSFTFSTSTNKLTVTNASTTALTISGTSYLGTVASGVWNGTAIGDAYLTKTGDWTGTLDGQEGTYYLDASNLSNFGTPFYTFFNATTTDALTEGSTNKYYSTALFASSLAGTTTDALDEGLTNKYYSDSLVNSYIHSSSTIPKTYTSNTFSNANVFNGNLTIGSLTGPLQAQSGLVSATSSVGVVYGGTGLTSAPSYGQLLVGNSSGGYTLTATSSLGISGGGGSGTVNSGTAGYLAYYPSTGTTVDDAGALYWDNSNSRLGIGTSSPYATLSVAGQIVGSYFTSTSTATSTFAGGISIAGDISPTADNTYSLGAPDLMWKDVYIGPGSLYINGKKVLEDVSDVVTFKTDSGQSLAIQTSGIGGISTQSTGSGNLDFLSGSGNININSTSGNINIGTTGSGQLNLGTIDSGVWNGTAIGDAYLTKTGDWTGTLDGQEGTYYLDASNLSNFGTPFYTFFNATTTDALTEGSTNKYYSDSSVASYISGSSTIPHIGGTAYGDVLYWTGSAWNVTATSSLGISGGGGSGTVNSGTAGYLAYYPSTGTTVDDAGALYWDNTNGRLGIGTSTPYAALSVVGQTVSSYFTATSTTATSTISGGTLVATEAGLFGVGTTTALAKLDVYGDAILSGSSRYINFGSTSGTNGYGFRDSAGTLEYKDSGGSWTSFASLAGGGSSQWTTSGNNIYYTTGNVGIGTTTPYTALSVVGEIVASNFTSTSTTATSSIAGLLTVDDLEIGALSFETNAGAVSWMDLPVTSSASDNTVESYSAQIDGNSVLTVYGQSDGAGGVDNLRVGIASSTPTYTLSVAGTVGFSGVTTNTGGVTSALCLDSNNQVTKNTDNETCVASSIRYKQNVFDIVAGSALSKLGALRPVTFEYTSATGITRYGFIAEEVELVDEQLVSYNDDGQPQSVRYTDIIPLITQAINEIWSKMEKILAWFSEAGDKFNVQGDVCVDDVCVTKEEFKAILQNAGGNSANSDQVGSSPDESSQETNSSDENNTEPNATSTDETTSTSTDDVVEQESPIESTTGDTTSDVVEESDSTPQETTEETPVEEPQSVEETPEAVVEEPAPEPQPVEEAPASE